MTRMHTLTSLPAEIQSIVISNLAYPDLLALRHTCQGFYDTINLTFNDRRDWLFERTGYGLPLPLCNLIMKTDEQFCSNRDVKRILYRRRKHLECADHGTGSCLVVIGDRCDGSDLHSKNFPSRTAGRIRLWLRDEKEGGSVVLKLPKRMCSRTKVLLRRRIPLFWLDFSLSIPITALAVALSYLLGLVLLQHLTPT